jgi:hypothetical protein
VRETVGQKGNLEIVVYNVLVLTNPIIHCEIQIFMNRNVSTLQHISMRVTKASKEIGNSMYHYGKPFPSW